MRRIVRNSSTIESQPGGRTGQRRSANKGQILPFLFFILTIIDQEEEGKDSQSIRGYDCSSPRDLKIWDASTKCKDKWERKIEDQKVTIVQRINEQWLTGFKCSVKLHWKSYYCGLLSYAKPILSAEQEETLLISSQECSSMADTSKFRTYRQNHLKPITVPVETYITEFENGYQDTADRGVHCCCIRLILDTTTDWSAN